MQNFNEDLIFKQKLEDEHELINPKKRKLENSNLFEQGDENFGALLTNFPLNPAPVLPKKKIKGSTLKALPKSQANLAKPPKKGKQPNPDFVAEPISDADLEFFKKEGYRVTNNYTSDKKRRDGSNIYCLFGNPDVEVGKGLRIFQKGNKSFVKRAGQKVLVQVQRKQNAKRKAKKNIRMTGKGDLTYCRYDDRSVLIPANLPLLDGDTRRLVYVELSGEKVRVILLRSAKANLPISEAELESFQKQGYFPTKMNTGVAKNTSFCLCSNPDQKVARGLPIFQKNDELFVRNRGKFVQVKNRVTSSESGACGDRKEMAALLAPVDNSTASDMSVSSEFRSPSPSSSCSSSSFFSTRLPNNQRQEVSEEELTGQLKYARQIISATELEFLEKQGYSSTGKYTGGAFCVFGKAEKVVDKGLLIFKKKNKTFVVLPGRKDPVRVQKIAAAKRKAKKKLKLTGTGGGDSSVSIPTVLSSMTSSSSSSLPTSIGANSLASARRLSVFQEFSNALLISPPSQLDQAQLHQESEIEQFKEERDVVELYLK